MALEIYVRETAAKVISDAVSTDGREMELLNMMLEGMPHLERSKAVTIHEKCKKLIKAIISSDMEKRQLDAFLTSSVKKKDGFPEDLAHALQQWWLGNQDQVRKILSEKIFCEPRLEDTRWSVSLQVQDQERSQMNVPFAGVSLQVRNPLASKVELVSFMANASQLENTLKQFEAVDMQIRKCCFGGKSP